MPGFITRDMIKEKKKQIVRAEKDALQNELSKENGLKEAVPEEVKAEIPKKKAKGPTAEELALEQRRKMAEALKATIKTGKEKKEKIEEQKVMLRLHSVAKRRGRKTERTGETRRGRS